MPCSVLLLLHRNQPVAPEQLIDDLWGDNAPATAANTLQVYVSQVRKIVADRLKTEGGAYRLRVEPDELDAERFERLAGEGATALGQKSYGEAAELLIEALALWRGPALADLRYDSFAQGEIARLEELRIAALEDRIEAELGLGRQEQLIGELESLVAEHPTRERLRTLLMLALYRAGRQADALEAYRQARETLLEELGLEPGPELRDLEQAILRQDEALSRRPLPESNIPVPVSSLVGRQRELAEITEALRGEARLLTLTGPGGSGKTRLATEAANALASELNDGAFFVALDTIRDPALLLPAIAQAVAVARVERPAPAREPRRAPGGAAGAPRDRQLRAARRGRADAVAGARGGSRLDLPRDEPRRASRQGREGVPGRPASSRRRRRALRRARPRIRPPLLAWPTATGSPSRRSAPGSTACRSRSSWPLPARSSCPPRPCSRCSTSASTC